MISPILNDNLSRLEPLFSGSTDLVYLHWRFGPDFCHTACSVYFKTLVQDKKTNYMKESLQDLVTHRIGPAKDIDPVEIMEFFDNYGVSAQSAKVINSFDEVVQHIIEGYIVILIDQWSRALAYNALQVEDRQVAEPLNESVVQGPRESTVENLEKNLGLLRTRLRSPQFKIVVVNAGGECRTPVAYGYHADRVPQDVLAEFQRRFQAVTQSEILETAYVESLLESSMYSPFPQFRYTERPDVAVAAILDGKIVVLTQGTGSMLICPGHFSEFFQSSEDYYQRSVISTMVRWLRVIAFFIALTLPSIYIAMSTFHPELIPTVLLLAVIDAREGIPFPAFFEAVTMEFFFELLREAGVRLPRPIGSAVSIVGALVIGEAAITAGIASPIMVVVVALTGIASFSIPQYTIAISLRVLRFPLMALSAALGGFGMMIGLLLILLHMSNLRTLGQPYLAPFEPFNIKAMRDVLVRAPLRILMRRPGRSEELRKLSKL